MRTTKTFFGIAAAASLALGGVAHASETTSVNMLPTSSYADRASAPASEASEVSGSGWLVGILAAALIVGGIFLAADGGDSGDTPG